MHEFILANGNFANLAWILFADGKTLIIPRGLVFKVENCIYFSSTILTVEKEDHNQVPIKINQFRIFYSFRSFEYWVYIWERIFKGK